MCLVLILKETREDIFKQVKKKLIGARVPCIVWEERRFPEDDRENWQEKYADAKFREILTKMGSKRQTRNWPLSALCMGERALLFAISGKDIRGKPFYGVAYNTKGDSCGHLNGGVAFEVSEYYETNIMDEICLLLADALVTFMTSKVQVQEGKGKNAKTKTVDKIDESLAPTYLTILTSGKERFYI